MLLDYSNSCVLTKMCNFVAELVILLAGTVCNFEKAGITAAGNYVSSTYFNGLFLCFVLFFLNSLFLCFVFLFLVMCLHRLESTVCIFCVREVL